MREWIRVGRGQHPGRIGVQLLIGATVVIGLALVGCDPNAEGGLFGGDTAEPDAAPEGGESGTPGEPEPESSVEPSPIPEPEPEPEPEPGEEPDTTEPEPTPEPEEEPDPPPEPEPLPELSVDPVFVEAYCPVWCAKANDTCVNLAGVGEHEVGCTNLCGSRVGETAWWIGNYECYLATCDLELCFGEEVPLGPDPQCDATCGALESCEAWELVALPTDDLGEGGPTPDAAICSAACTGVLAHDEFAKPLLGCLANQLGAGCDIAAAEGCFGTGLDCGSACAAFLSEGGQHECQNYQPIWATWPDVESCTAACEAALPEEPEGDPLPPEPEPEPEGDIIEPSADVAEPEGDASGGPAPPEPDIIEPEGDATEPEGDAPGAPAPPAPDVVEPEADATEPEGDVTEPEPPIVPQKGSDIVRFFGCVLGTSCEDPTTCTSLPAEVDAGCLAACEAGEALCGAPLAGLPSTAYCADTCTGMLAGIGVEVVAEDPAACIDALLQCPAVEDAFETLLGCTVPTADKCTTICDAQAACTEAGEAGLTDCLKACTLKQLSDPGEVNGVNLCVKFNGTIAEGEYDCEAVNGCLPVPDPVLCEDLCENIAVCTATPPSDDCAYSGCAEPLASSPEGLTAAACRAVMDCDKLDDCKKIGKEAALQTCIDACAGTDTCFEDFGPGACAKVCTGVMGAYDHHSELYAQCTVEALGATCTASAVPGACY